MRVGIDDVVCQLASGRGIWRVWDGLLTELRQQGHDLVVFSRTGEFDKYASQIIPFREYSEETFASDFLDLNTCAASLDLDFFASTYYTSVWSVPTVLIVHDLIPERFGFSDASNGWLIRKLSFHAANSKLAVSRSTLNDLQEIYPYLANNTKVANPAFSKESFYFPRDKTKVDLLYKHLGITRGTAVVLVGSRVDYKNGQKLVELAKTGKLPGPLVLVGGEQLEDGSRIHDAVTGRPLVIQVKLADNDLGLLLSGAACLVVTSKYEGFGLPALEAVASGCPVVCSSISSLAEASQGLGIFVDTESQRSLLAGIEKSLKTQFREDFLRDAKEKTSGITWEEFADKFLETGVAAISDFKTSTAKLNSVAVRKTFESLA